MSAPSIAMRPLAAALVLVLSHTAWAQEGQPRSAPVYRSCFGANVSAEGTVIHGDPTGIARVPVPSIPSGSSNAVAVADAPLSGVPNGGGELLLAAVVVAAVALPVVLYVVDEDADEEVLFQYGCPHLDFRMLTGTIATPGWVSPYSTLAGGQLRFLAGPIGFDASVESTMDSRFYGTADAHLLLRPPPKQHVELGVALGYRRVVFGGAMREGFEVGLPHQYVFTRIWNRPLGIQIMPAAFMGDRGVDFRLEGNLNIPLGPLSFQVGGRAFSFDQDVRAGAQLGFGLSL